MLEGLFAEQRGSAAPVELETFGRFVGSWLIDNRSRPSADGEWSTSTLRWTFAWILDGLAIQDVLQLQDGAGWGPAVGTTLRQWMPQHDSWHVTWWCPPAQEHVVLTGGRIGERIVLTGVQADGRKVRWVFSEITDDAFTWDGECSDDAGDTWWHEQHMDAHRI